MNDLLVEVRRVLIKVNCVPPLRTKVPDGESHANRLVNCGVPYRLRDSICLLKAYYDFVFHFHLLFIIISGGHVFSLFSKYIFLSYLNMLVSESVFHGD